MNEVKQIISDLKNGLIRPIYFLMGDESYFIDKITEFIDDQILTAEEKEFNQTVVYGRDTNVSEIIAQAKCYPMMADKTVVIVKEAQDLSRNIEDLIDYVLQPLETTVLVVCYKYKTLDKRKKLCKAIEKTGVLFESKTLYENQVVDWVLGYVKNKKYIIDPKSAQMLVNFLGNDLTKIANELGKLMLVLPIGSIISMEEIEKNIGVSKDFNVFELKSAVAKKNVLKSNQIINYFIANQKNNPLVLVISNLNSFFTQLLVYHGLQDKSKQNVAKVLKVNIYFIDEHVIAAQQYSMRKVSQIISFLREADLRSKGVGANHMTYADIIKELLFKILH